MVKVAVARDEELALVRHFYAEVGYGGGVSESDLTLVARAEGDLVGVVRVCKEAGVIVLRGMHVHPERQRTLVMRRPRPDPAVGQTASGRLRVRPTVAHVER